MVLLIHIIIALASIAYTTYLFVAPAQSRFKVSYGLVFLTVLSGSFLVVATPAYIVHACVAGLIYTIAVLAGIIAAQYRYSRRQA